MFNLGFPELVIILVLALIIFGPGKLPQVGAALGKGINEFKKAARDIQDGLEADPGPPARPASENPTSSPANGSESTTSSK